MPPDSAPETTTSTAPEAPTARRWPVYGRLFVISFVILFLELACIRWFASSVVFLTFFTNLVLMACFLGMSVGSLAASRKLDLINAVIPIMLVAIALSWGLLTAYTEFARVTIDVGGQQSPQQVFFGTEVRRADPSQFVIPIEVIAGFFFTMIALAFVGLGQEMGRSFTRATDRVAAYTANVLGSLVGIGAFGLASYLRTSPPVWFGIGFALLLPFVTRWRWLQTGGALVALGLLVFASHGTETVARWAGLGQKRSGPVQQTYWSPYYKVDFTPGKPAINTNNILHQGMLSVPKSGPAYVLPHFLNRDAGNKPFEDVMIIGAGSGNDVRCALYFGAKHVDAVEIDPVLNEIGRAYHPDHPYDDPRVSIHLDDGRSFLHKTDRKYDLISYALVDSLVLHSGYSSLRLESFLFTEEAFRDIKAKLKPNGVFAMYNYYRQGWVIGRLVQLARRVFGTEPIVISVPYKPQIKSDDTQHGAITFLLVGTPESTAVEAIRSAFQKHHSFWSYQVPLVNEAHNSFGPAATDPDSIGFRIKPAALDEIRPDLLPSDNWPFLYLREPTIPMLNIRGIVLVAVLSLLILLAFAPVRTARPNGQMFFLGAGFMLLETKGVVHMALLFGSTWVVNSIVFAAILIMILLSNLYVILARPRRQWPYYALLVASLAVNAAVPMSVFLGLPGLARIVVSCLVVFVPVFFAGVVFATAFRDSRRSDIDYGSNIGGVILGGLSENLSLIVGFNNLLVVAAGYYVLSALLRPRAGGSK